MPQQVIRNGRMYTEYTPQELEEIKLNNTIREQLKRGQSWHMSTLLIPQDIRNGGKKPTGQ